MRFVLKSCEKPKAGDIVFCLTIAGDGMYPCLITHEQYEKDNYYHGLDLLNGKSVSGSTKFFTVEPYEPVVDSDAKPFDKRVFRMGCD